MACTRPYSGRCLGGAIRQKSPGSRVGLVARLEEATNAIGLLCLPAHQLLLRASRRKNSRNAVLGSGTEVCISVDSVAEGARTRIGRLSISRACTARGSDLPCLVLRTRRSERPLRLIAEPPHDLGGLTDVCLAQFVAHSRSNHQKPRVQLAVTRIALASKAHQFRSPMPRIVNELHEPLGRQLIRQPLHALAACRTHLGDLRDGEGANHR